MSSIRNFFGNSVYNVPWQKKETHGVHLALCLFRAIALPRILVILSFPVVGDFEA